MMRKTGFDPAGMVHMFNQLSNASRLNEGMGGGGYTSTHPLSIQRMSDIQNRVAELPVVHHKDSDAFRSEEHTSELQSLMRTSYAVFCLKKKKHNKNHKT